MIINTISIAIIFVSAAILAIIIGRRMRVVASINVRALPQEQEALVRKRLIRDKLDRKMEHLKKWFIYIIGPSYKYIHIVRRAWSRLYANLEALQSRVVKKTPLQEQSSIEVISQISATQTPLFVAQSALEKGDFDEAEKAFIDVLRTDPRSEHSYRGLADLYAQKKDFELAYESLLYLWKLIHGQKGREPEYSDSQTAYDLWDVCFKLEKTEEAGKWAQEALNGEPNNPKFLDAAIKTYIASGDKIRAERVLEKLRASNPQNNKLEEFSQLISDLSY